MEFYIFLGSLSIAVFSILLAYAILRKPNIEEKFSVGYSRDDSVEINKAFDDIEYFNARHKKTS